MDNGHYHPTEVVSDKIASILAFDEKMALHVTRGVRWDSDHVVLFLLRHLEPAGRGAGKPPQ